MLLFEGDVESTFMQTFRISCTDVFGNTISHDLKENGDDIKVTKENRQVRNENIYQKFCDSVPLRSTLAVVTLFNACLVSSLL